MLIKNFARAASGGTRVLSATVVWEDRDFPQQELTFKIGESQSDCEPDTTGNGASPLLSGDNANPEAFLAACFPLAAVHGEARVKIDARACPMLVEGLLTAHAWWSSWGGMPTPAPEIETRRDGAGAATLSGAPRRAVALFSGGVDSLHMLMRNHQLYSPDDPAYIRDALFVHGFDIGKRRRDPEDARYRAALRRLEPVAAETGVRLIACRTNLRHLPSQPGFWEDRHNGAGLAAMGHAATLGPAFVFIGGSHSLSTLIPWGSHPAVDGLYSSQRVSVIHDGARFSRLEKVRDLAGWPAALAALRPCPAQPTAARANCGRCEKCLRTRLELLAAGIEETDALGPSFTPVELWRDIEPNSVGERVMHYEELLPALRSRGFDRLCRVLDVKLAIYQQRDRRQLSVA